MKIFIFPSEIPETSRLLHAIFQIYGAMSKIYIFPSKILDSFTKKLKVLQESYTFHCHLAKEKLTVCAKNLTLFQGNWQLGYLEQLKVHKMVEFPSDIRDWVCQKSITFLAHSGHFNCSGVPRGLFLTEILLIYELTHVGHQNSSQFSF